MVETVEIKQEETTSEKPVDANVTQSKPAFISIRIKIF